jgi:CheY-like chemotaxis protein
MRKKILIADDDRTILDVITIILDRAGYITDTTPNGKTLLNSPPQGFDLILLDVKMSGVDGFFICKYLKSQESTKHIPIVMVSAIPELKTLTENAGADGYLEKPFNSQELLHVVSRFIDDKPHEDS